MVWFTLHTNKQTKKKNHPHPLPQPPEKAKDGVQMTMPMKRQNTKAEICQRTKIKKMTENKNDREHRAGT